MSTLQFENEAEREFWHDVYLREVDSNFPETALAKTDAALLEFRARSAKLRESNLERPAGMGGLKVEGMPKSVKEALAGVYPDAPASRAGEACKHPGCPGTLVVGGLGLQCSACGPCVGCQEFPGPAGVCRCGKPASITACLAQQPQNATPAPDVAPGEANGSEGEPAPFRVWPERWEDLPLLRPPTETSNSGSEQDASGEGGNHG